MIIRWVMLCMAVVAIIVVPFLVAGIEAEAWTNILLSSVSEHSLWFALVLALLLASDILLPIPSSIVSTAAGFLLGFPAGTFISWIGMTLCCVVGYWLGYGSRTPIVQKLLGERELSRLEYLSKRYGDWALIVARPVPVLAEASVLFAGISHMNIWRYVFITAFSNLGISIVYAAIGAFSMSLNSFLWAFVGSIGVPLVAMLLLRSAGHKYEP